jgi:hypothetical protein
MDDLPQELRPTGTFQVRLISGQDINLPLCQPTFKDWLGVQPPVTFGRKKVLNYEDQLASPKEKPLPRWVHSHLIADHPTLSKEIAHTVRM